MRLVSLTALALVLAACGSVPHVALTVHVSVDDHAYTLTCRPAGGSIPSASRLCGDISRYPIAMLAPAKTRSVCSPAVDAPLVAVSSARGTFSGYPGCDWPGGTALEVYWAAATRQSHTLAVAEPRLRCDQDPLLLATPTPWRSAFACTHGLWTPRTEQLIARASRVPAIASLGASFPHDIGVEPCSYRRGGLGSSPIHGMCEVNVVGVWSLPQVRFTETWDAGRKRHTWVVTVSGTTPRVTAQHGPAPPQAMD